MMVEQTGGAFQASAWVTAQTTLQFSSCASKCGGEALVVCCRRVVVSVPEDAFEMNYVFTDGEGATDNNQGHNYLTVVDSQMTPEEWAELAMDRLVRAYIVAVLLRLSLHKRILLLQILCHE